MILIKNILILLLFFIKKEKVILINESAGLGDYIWVRNYFKLIKSDVKYKNYKIAICATKRWLDFAIEMDSDYVDIFLPFKNPYKPKLLELIPLIIFKFDIFINFRASSKYWETINNTVHSKTTYTDEIFRNKNFIYPNLYDKIMAQFLPSIIAIPGGVKHNLKITEGTLIKCDYCILTLGGYSQGKLNYEQLKTIIETVYNNTKLKIIILGTKSDKSIFKNLKRLLPEYLSEIIVSGCGVYKTSLLPYLIYNSKFVITTNTSVWHFCIQLNTKHILLSIEEPWIYNLSDYKYFDFKRVKYITAKDSILNIKLSEIKNKTEEFIREVVNV